MALDGLSAGQDCKLTFTDANGNIQVSKIQNFRWKYDTNIPKKILMSGATLHPKFWQGCSGSFSVFRSGADLEIYFSEGEQSYLLGGDQIPVTITETIRNIDGTYNQWQFINGVLDLSDGGDFNGNDVVEQTVTFYASQRLRTI